MYIHRSLLDRIVSYRIREEGDKKVLELYNRHHRVQMLFTNQNKLNRQHDFSVFMEGFSLLCLFFQISLSLHSVGLSLVNTVPEELLYTYVYQIEANYKVTKNHEQGCIRIKDIQVCTFPLLLRIRLLLNNINPCSLLLAL